MWQVVIEFFSLENNFFDERSIQTCSPFSCCSLASFQFKLDKFIFIITIKQAAGCNKIQLMCKWQLHAFLQNSEVINNMSHAAWLMLHILYIGSVHPLVKSLFSKFQPLWVILFELGEFWWISKNGENGFESDDLWFQQLRLSCHFLTNWFELFWFIMLKDTRHPAYTSCPISDVPASVYATIINHLIRFISVQKQFFFETGINIGVQNIKLNAPR